MGTRNLSCLVVDGKYVIAQYGQFDGYPSGQGLTILNFLRDDLDETMLRQQLNKIVVVNDELWQDMWASVGVPKGVDRVSDDQSRAFQDKYPFVHRSVAGEIFGYVQNTKRSEIHLKVAPEFAGDGLFCEWAYVVDLDKRTFEVYTGFHRGQAPEGQRFADQPLAGTGYGQVQFHCMFDLDNLPSDKEFLAIAEHPSEDDE